MSSVELALATAAALVLGVAGTLKLADETLRYRALGTAEVAIAVALFVPATRVGALIAGTVLGACFTAYALVRDRPCRCFGERLRVASRPARLFRAGGALFLCAAALAASLGAGPAAETGWRATPVVVGAVIAALVILVPPLLSFEIHDDAEEARINV